MPWPALIGPALSVASSLFGKKKRRRAPEPAAPAPLAIPTLVGRAVSAVTRAGLPARRRGRRRGLTMREMEKIAMLKAIGAPPAAIMMAVMRAMGGRI